MRSTSKREPAISGREALKVHRLIDALLEAGATGQTVEVVPHPEVPAKQASKDGRTIGRSAAILRDGPGSAARAPSRMRPRVRPLTRRAAKNF
jgi:hypothetical protein